MSAYRKDFDETNYLSFLIKDDELSSEKYNKIWEKVENITKKEFDSKPVYNEKYLKAKIKSSNKIPKEGSQFICLSVLLIDSVLRTGKNYYPQVFLDKCKHVVKEKKIPKYILDTEISSDSEESYF